MDEKKEAAESTEPAETVEVSEKKEETNAEKATRIAIMTRDFARSHGADDAIVMVSIDAPAEDASNAGHFVCWVGHGMAIRGLLEICAEKMRKIFVSPG